MLVRVDVLADDGELLHLETGDLQFFDRFFCGIVGSVHGDDGVVLGHGFPFLVERAPVLPGVERVTHDPFQQFKINQYFTYLSWPCDIACPGRSK
jgi:hypothetical protein